MPRIARPREPKIELHLGDCLDVFRDVRGLGAIVTDPPAGIGFMGRGWDKDRGGREKWIAYWAERFAVALDACEDNAVGLFWALPRTSHWTACAVEDAGWRIRDVITHHFGQGWPKDKNALKPSSEHWILAIKGKPVLGIDACRVERGAGDVSGWSKTGSKAGANLSLSGANTERQPKPDNALGSWPTNLVLSHFASDDGAFCCEPCGTRKVRGENPRSLTSATMGYGGGGLGCTTITHGGDEHGAETVPAYLCAVGCDCGASWLAESGGAAPRCACGREAWWACPVAELDGQGRFKSIGRPETGGKPRANRGVMARSYSEGSRDRTDAVMNFPDAGGPARFFPRFAYYGKAPSCERHAGCEDLLWRADKREPFGFVQVTREEWEALDPKDRTEGNVHPTVKRLSLMRWLHKLTGAKRIGDLCGGSGSGAVAAYLDGIEWIGAEVSPQAIEIANARLAWWRSLGPEARVRLRQAHESRPRTPRSLDLLSFAAPRNSLLNPGTSPWTTRSSRSSIATASPW
jgi:hypothetical protein